MRELLAALRPISLAELNEQARLMSRVDRKYFVPRPLFTDLIGETSKYVRVLEIDGLRSFRYHTVYFDTADFEFFRHHVQGRRHRFKVRTRTYCDTGLCQLEVKSKGYRGRTVKQRIPHDPHSMTRLGAEGVSFVAPIIGSDPTRLLPVVETIYDRVTLTDGDQRITCDLDLRCRASTGLRHGPDDVLVETKSEGDQGRWDQLLRHAGIRPHSVSKYCIAAALHNPDLRANRWHRTIERYFG